MVGNNLLADSRARLDNVPAVVPIEWLLMGLGPKKLTKLGQRRQIYCREAQEMKDRGLRRVTYPSEALAAVKPEASLAWKSLSSAATLASDKWEPQVLEMVWFPKLGAAKTEVKPERTTRAAEVKCIAAGEELAVETEGVRKSGAKSVRFYALQSSSLAR